MYGWADGDMHKTVLENGSLGHGESLHRRSFTPFASTCNPPYSHTVHASREDRFSSRVCFRITSKFRNQDLTALVASSIANSIRDSQLSGSGRSRPPQFFDPSGEPIGNQRRCDTETRRTASRTHLLRNSGSLPRPHHGAKAFV